MDIEKKQIVDAERRNFLKLSASGAFTAAVVAGVAGTDRKSVV